MSELANSSTNPPVISHEHDSEKLWKRSTNDDGFVAKNWMSWIAAKHPDASKGSAPGTSSAPETAMGWDVPVTFCQRLPSLNRSLIGSAGPFGSRVTRSSAVPAGSPVLASISVKSADRLESVPVTSAAIEKSVGSSVSGVAGARQNARSPKGPSCVLFTANAVTTPSSFWRKPQSTTTAWSVNRVAGAALTMAGTATIRSTAVIAASSA